MNSVLQRRCTKDQAKIRAEKIKNSILYRSDASTVETQYNKASLLYAHTTSKATLKDIDLCYAPALAASIKLLGLPLSVDRNLVCAPSWLGGYTFVRASISVLKKRIDLLESSLDSNCKLDGVKNPLQISYITSQIEASSSDSFLNMTHTNYAKALTPTFLSTMTRDFQTYGIKISGASAILPQRRNDECLGDSFR